MVAAGFDAVVHGLVHLYKWIDSGLDVVVGFCLWYWHRRWARVFFYLCVAIYGTRLIASCGHLLIYEQSHELPPIPLGWFIHVSRVLTLAAIIVLIVGIVHEKNKEGSR